MKLAEKAPFKAYRGRMKYPALFSAAAVCTLLLGSCSILGGGVRNAPVRFALTGNTSPTSPYQWEMEAVEMTVSALNRENPDFVIHTGNMVFGGNRAEGISRIDVERQFDSFLASFSRLNPVLYTICGESDLHDATPYIYTEKTRRPLRYSFNYGRYHFVLISNFDSKEKGISSEDIYWLESDLASFISSGGIFILSHRALSLSTGEHSGRLRALLKAYPVKALISGESGERTDVSVDSVRIINTGCVTGSRRNSFQYCVAAFSGSELSITWHSAR